jgi:hypothetical protein
LTADAAAAAETVFVRDNAPITVGALILIDLDNGQQEQTTVTSTVGSTGEVAISGQPLPSAASEGNLLTVITYHDSTLVVGIDNFGQWEDGMNMEITLGNGNRVEFEVSFLDPDSGYLTLSSSLSSDTPAGALVKRKIGPAEIALTAFGTFPTSDPVIGDPEWGFRGTIAHNASDLALGMRVRGEITAVDGALNLTRKAVATVINQ